MQKLAGAALLAVLLGAPFHGQAAEPSISAKATLPVRHAVMRVGAYDMFYREAGPKDAPTILLLHGFPSSSRMFERLMPLLADRYRLVAPDYIGFGHSDAPSPDRYAYTFDHLAESVDGLVAGLGLRSYVLYMSDYGAPVGFRLALKHPERVTALVVQNAVAHEEGLKASRWDSVRAFWNNRAANEMSFRRGFELEATRARHIGASPNPERYSPDLWTDEFAFLSRPGQHRIQSDLFYDYQSNLAAYPDWQAYLRRYRPPVLVTWGKYDPSFTVAGAYAYAKQVPDAEVHVLDAGHFALDEANEEIAGLMRDFLRRRMVDAGEGNGADAPSSLMQAASASR